MELERDWSALPAFLGQYLAEPEDQKEPAVEEEKVKKTTTFSGDLFQKIAASQGKARKETPLPTLTLTEEIEIWRLEPDLPLRVEVSEGKFDYPDPLEWWSTNKTAKRLKILCSVAEIVLAIPATSASSERCASAAGRVVTAERTRLLAHKVEKLTFAHMNFKLFGPK